MIRTAWKVVVLCAIGSAGAAPSPGAEPAAGSAARFASESKILAAQVEAAGAAWTEQHALYGDLVAAVQRLERLYADSGATAAELRAAETEYEAALDATVRQARRTIERRRAVYDAMDRLEKLGREVEREAGRAAERAARETEPRGAFGNWMLDLDFGRGDLVGLMKLEGDGTLVRGSYRLSNGRHGTLAGTFLDGKLALTRVDAEAGQDASLEATLDTRSGDLLGTWQKLELASGQPAAGSWKASRVAAGDELPELGAE